MNNAGSQIDLNGLVLAVAVGGAIAAIGVGIDALLRPHNRSSVSRSVKRWWVMINATTIPHLPARMADVTVRIEQFIFGRALISVRSVLTICLLSVFLTFNAMFLGWVPARDFYSWDQYFTSLGQLLSLRVFLGPDDNVALMLFNIYFANMIFDFLSITITFFIIRVIASYKGRFSYLLIADVAFAFLLAILCASFVMAFWTYAAMGHVVPLAHLESGMHAVFVRAPDFFQQFYDGTLEFEKLTSGYAMGVFAALYGFTTFIPTLIYALIFLSIAYSLLILRLVRWIALHLLSLDMETERSIFFYTGTAIGLFIVVAKLSITIVSIVA